MASPNTGAEDTSGPDKRGFKSNPVITLADDEIDKILCDEQLTLWTSDDNSTGYYHVYQTIHNFRLSSKYYKCHFGTARTAALYLARYIKRRPYAVPWNKDKAKVISMTEQEAAACVQNEQLEIFTTNAASGYLAVYFQDNYWRVTYTFNHEQVTLKTRFATPIAAAVHYARIVKRSPSLHPLQRKISKHFKKLPKKLSNSNVDKIAEQEGLTLVMSSGTTGYKGVRMNLKKRMKTYTAVYRPSIHSKAAFYSRELPTARMAALEYARFVRDYAASACQDASLLMSLGHNSE